MDDHRSRSKGAEPAAYRRIGERFWDSPEWTDLPPGPPNARALILWLAVGPVQRSMPGVLRIGEGEIADRLGWPIDDVRRLLSELAAAEVLRHDSARRLMWLPWRYGPDHEEPSNVSVILGWKETVARLPACELTSEIWAFLRAKLTARGQRPGAKEQAKDFVAVFDSLPWATKERSAWTPPRGPPSRPPTMPPGGDPPRGVGGHGGGTSVSSEAVSSEAVREAKALVDVAVATPTAVAGSPPVSELTSPAMDPSPQARRAAPGERKPTDEPGQVFEHWKRVMGKNAGTVFDKKRRLAVVAQLKAGRTVADLCMAIDGCAKDPFSMGQNDRGRKFNDIELICRDAKRVEAFMGYADDNPTWAEAPEGRQPKPSGYGAASIERSDSYRKPRSASGIVEPDPIEVFADDLEREKRLRESTAAAAPAEPLPPLEELRRARGLRANDGRWQVFRARIQHYPQKQVDAAIEDYFRRHAKSQRDHPLEYIAKLIETGVSTPPGVARLIGMRPSGIVPAGTNDEHVAEERDEQARPRRHGFGSALQISDAAKAEHQIPGRKFL